METYLTQLTNYLLTQSWQIAVLVAVIAAAAAVLKNRSAHIRYLLWLIVLGKCLVPPLLTVPLAVLPVEQLSEPTPVSAPRATAMEFEEADVPVAEVPASPRSFGAVAPAAPERAVGFTRRQWLSLAWAAGVAVFLLFAATKALRTNLWLRRQRRPLSDKVQGAIEGLFSGLGLNTFPKVWLVEGIGQPFVWGLLHGGIYLPADFVKSDDAEHRRGVLGHELSHVLRLDAAVNLVQIIAQAVFWFHPLVWWANRRIRGEREKCCDETAIAYFGAKVKDYSSAIVNTLINEYESTRPVPSLAIAGPVKNIEERIKTIMKPGKKFYKHPSLVTATVVLLSALLTVPAALVLTVRAETKPNAEAKEKSPTTPGPATAEDKAVATAALFRAIRDKNVEKMRLAINLGADLDGKNKDAIWLVGDIQSIGCTPLYVAVGVPDNSNVDLMIGLLLEAGANPNTRGPDGQIPLHAVARGGGIARVDLLVSGGSDVNVADKEGRTPAIIAFELGNADTFDLMVGSGATVSTNLMSAYKGSLSRVQSLIGNGKAQERFEQGLTLLHAAAAGGQTAIVDLLLTNGLDVHSKTQAGYTALHHAVAGNHREVAELLLAKGADVNAELGKQTPLHWAISKQHKDMIAWLLASGANPNADGGDYWGTPLHWAVWWWDVEAAVLLVSHGGDIHLKTQKFPYSPLFDAVLKGNRAMVEALITKTGDTAAARWAPLQATVASGDLQAVEDLLDKGADVNAKDEKGGITLHMAASKGHKDIAELLITRGADVNAESGRRSTPLHGAAKQGHKALAELLLAKGADVNAKNNEGETPLSMAEERGHREIIELLRKHGAKE